MKALPKILHALTGVAALSLAYPASVQAVPTTYTYTGNPFTDVSGPYTTSDFVTAMVTFAGPLGANMPLTEVIPTAFTFFDGVQTISNTTPGVEQVFSVYATNARGEIIGWSVGVILHDPAFRGIDTTRDFLAFTGDFGGGDRIGSGSNTARPGVWSTPETGSTLSLMTVTLMALGLVARRFQRAAG